MRVWNGLGCLAASFVFGDLLHWFHRDTSLLLIFVGAAFLLIDEMKNAVKEAIEETRESTS